MADNAPGVLFKGLRGGMVVLDAPRLKLCKVIGRASTVHGIRSTFRDWAAAQGIDRDTAERCLSHEVGTDTERAYLRRDFLEERRAVLERWAAVMLA
jgi:integrase